MTSTSTAPGRSSAAEPDRRLLSVRGQQVKLLVGGEGPPLLYLHDAGSGGAWLPIHELLAQHFTVYAPDHPGFGESSDFLALTDVGDIATLYAEVLDLLGLGQPVAVVGASFGGWIAAELGARHPGLVDAMVLIDAIGLPVDNHPVNYEFDADVQWAAETLFHDPSAFFALFPSEPGEEFIKAVQRSATSFARFAREARCHDPHLPRLLPNVTASTLVLWGAEDRLVPQEHGQRYVELIPEARFVAIEECGHAAPIEKPAEISRATVEFVAACRSSTP